MARRREVPKRVIHPEPKYGDRLLSKFMNVVMVDGKKAVAERMIYGALDEVAEKSGEDAIVVFKQALDNVKPAVEVKSRRVGGANYQVPVEIRPERRVALALRWLRDHARQRSERTMGRQLAQEILEAAQGRGGAVKKKDDTHRMAEANKAFAHFRW